MIILNNSWEYETAYTAYPFVDDATLVDRVGTLRIQLSWFTECKLWPIIQSDEASSMVCYISSIEKSSNELRIHVSNAIKRIGTAYITDFSKARYPFFNEEKQVIGFFSCTPLAMSHLFEAANSDIHVFDMTATKFLPHVYVPNVVSFVSKITDNNDQSPGNDVLFVGGEGVHLSYDEPENAVRVDAIGDALYNQANCAPSLLGLQQILRPVRKLKIVQDGKEWIVEPNSNGVIRFYIEASDTAPSNRTYKIYDSPGVLISRIT